MEARIEPQGSGPFWAFFVGWITQAAGQFRRSGRVSHAPADQDEHLPKQLLRFALDDVRYVMLVTRSDLGATPQDATNH
jgi:hypothetical protein